MQTPSRPCRVLLVEDNPDDEQITLRALRQAPGVASVEVARDGAEALEALRRLCGENRIPDLVLLDLKLPKLTGIEVLRETRLIPECEHLNVVAFTSSDEAKDIEECQSLGVSDYVRKPVDFDEYLSAVESILRKCTDVSGAA